ncbi:MAG: ComEC/Rec2 family competence protein [Planktotalea sp.]|uniref:ComEC/Rec2 family competence protein n=1 Tax=Planktotalea sp. TaxID=2029877 RepID=UPI003C775A50
MDRDNGWRALFSAELTQGFVFSPVVFSLGILLYFQAPVEPQIWQGALAFSCAVLFGLALGRAGYSLRPVFWALALFAAGFSAAAWRSTSIAAPVLDWRYYGPVEGRVVGLDRSGSGALRVTLDQIALGRRAPDETPEKVRISLFGDDAQLRPKAGARVMTTAHLSPPSGPAEPHGFDFQRYAWFEQLGGLGYSRLPLLLAAPPERNHTFFAWRLAISERVQSHLSGQTGAFAAALMTGDRSGLSQETLNDLRHSNLAHLLAISGLHMGLLAGFVFAALRVLFALTPPLATGQSAKKIAALGGLIAAAGYLGLSGGSVATERAFVMAAVALGAVMLERRAISLRAVALAALIILLRKPEAVTGPGFQMSFAATTALVITFNLISARRMGGGPGHPLVRIISGTVISSAVAGLATLPIAAAHFNIIAHYGLAANLISVPLMGVLIIPLGVIAVCLLPFNMEGIPLYFMGFGLDWILSVAHEVAHWPSAITTVPAPPGWAFFMLCSGFLLLGLMASKLRFLCVAPICVGAIAWATVERPDVLIADTGNLVGVLLEKGRALNKAKGAGFVAGVWLENDGDASDQWRAAQRWGEGVNATSVSERTIYAASGKRGLAAFKGCSVNDIAIFSEAFEGSAPCEIFDITRLKQTGSVALTFKPNGALEITTARAVAGRRYWNDKALRKTRWGHQ